MNFSISLLLSWQGAWKQAGKLGTGEIAESFISSSGSKQREGRGRETVSVAVF